MRRIHFTIILVLTLAAFSTALAEPARSFTPGRQPVEQSEYLLAKLLPDRYVNAVTGDDAYSCLSPATACRSIQAAIDTIPMILAMDVTVHIAQGRYEGGILISERISRHLNTITLRGEPDALIAGSGLHDIGITVWRTSGVILENLRIQDFGGSGVRLWQASPTKLLETTVAGNGRHGIDAVMSDLYLFESTIENNGVHGISAHSGFMTVAGSLWGVPTTLSGNRGAAVHATDSEVIFHGRTDVIGNGAGMISDHGAVVDLDRRSDLHLYDNLVGDLIADCHGMIIGFEGAQCDGACDCAEVDYGVCRITASRGPGGISAGIPGWEPGLPAGEEKEKENEQGEGNRPGRGL